MGISQTQDKELEKEVLHSLQKIRSDPQSFIPYLETRMNSLKWVKEKNYEEPDKFQSLEGPKLFYETINYLRKQDPIRELDQVKGMDRSALDHVEDIGPKGLLTNIGTNGSDALQRGNRYGLVKGELSESITFGSQTGIDVICDLLLDDGNEDRNNRKIMRDPNFTVVGVGCGTHKIHKKICTIDFVAQYDGRECDLKKESEKFKNHRYLLQGNRQKNDEYKEMKEQNKRGQYRLNKQARDEEEQEKKKQQSSMFQQQF